MGAEASSYEVLGLRPGAERSVVDLAYRGLMKRHHPDHGGDGARAAEINRAYADITRVGAIALPSERPSGDLAAALYQRRVLGRAARANAAKRRRRWPWVAPALLLIGGVGWIERDALADAAWHIQWRFFPPEEATPGRPPGGAFTGDQTTAGLDRAPIPAGVIRAASSRARALMAGGGVDEAAGVSRACYEGFVRAPSLAVYDSCVAFDDAVLLTPGARAVDRGMFGAAAVTTRQLAAGRLLGARYDLIEDRLDRMRLSTLHAVQSDDEPAQSATAAVMTAAASRPDEPRCPAAPSAVRIAPRGCGSASAPRRPRGKGEPPVSKTD